MMTTPKFSAPILFTPEELRSKPAITAQILRLVNNAFRRSKLPEPDKWDLTNLRFPTPESYYDVLDGQSIVVLIFDENQKDDDAEEIRQELKSHLNGQKGPSGGRIVGCSGAIPWRGGWLKEGAGIEEGFEIKAISVDSHEAYLRKGLAVQMLDCMTDYLIQEAKKDCVESAEAEDGALNRHITLWILAADCINGAYWRKRGYHEVRRRRATQGIWGCKTEFDMIVLRKDVKYGL